MRAGAIFRRYTRAIARVTENRTTVEIAFLDGACTGRNQLKDAAGGTLFRILIESLLASYAGRRDLD